MTEAFDPKAELNAQGERFRVVLENITVGVCCFDADQRLVLSNRRYAEIYGQPPEQVAPGMTLAEVMKLRGSVGSLPVTTGDAYIAEIQEAVRLKQNRSIVRHLRNGRIVAIRHQPLPGGGWVATHEDVTERQLAEQRLTHLAHHDPLTGLANRTLLHETLEQALAACDDTWPCAVISIDLDRFKDVNDTLGHAVGDEVLRAVARRLRTLVPPEDLLVRAGNNEFVVVQRGGRQPEEALALWRTLSAALARPFRALDQSVTISASCGISVAPDDGRGPEQILRNAALALSAARAGGGGRAEVFAPVMNAAAQRRRMLDSELRSAVARGELELAFQPVAKMKLRRVGGFEALLRWTHPEIGRVSPAEFIPLAEQNGLIVPIGAWVLRTACATAALWPDGLTVAVNVSAAQFHAPGLLATITEALAESGLPARQLELEITESAMMHNWQDTAAILRQIKQLGVRIAMDDFGTGYSSLSYLRRFPFDKIKIDQSFVRDLTSNTESVAIVRAIVALCDALGMSTTAEGVETQEQFAILAAEGCANVQGYLLSKPRPAADVAEMLATLNVGLSELRPINGPARPRRPTVAALRLPAYAAAPGAGA